MRRIIIVLSLLGLTMVGYLAWPIYTLVSLARAVEARDVATVMRHVDVDSVRRSLTNQIIETYLKLTGKLGSPLLRGAVARGAGSIADPMVAKLLAPEALADFLRTGWPAGVSEDRPPGTIGLTTANLGSAWQTYRSARYGYRRFEIAVPPALPHDRRIELEFRIIKWRWRLAEVRLPEHLRVQLSQMLIKSLPKS